MLICSSQNCHLFITILSSVHHKLSSAHHKTVNTTASAHHNTVICSSQYCNLLITKLYLLITILSSAHHITVICSSHYCHLLITLLPFDHYKTVKSNYYHQLITKLSPDHHKTTFYLSQRCVSLITTLLPANVVHYDSLFITN